MSIFASYKRVELAKVLASIALGAVAALGMVAAAFSETENPLLLGIASGLFFLVLVWDSLHPLPPKCAPTRRRIS